MLEKKRMFLNVAAIDFKEHKKNYFENLRKMEESKKINREKSLQDLITKQPFPQLIYDSSKLLKNDTSNTDFFNQQ